MEANPNQIPGGRRQAQVFNQAAQITSAEFAAKFQSKREVYRFLASEVKMYLPPLETITIWHCRDLQSGAKKRIRSDLVKHINVPQFEGLSIENMQAFAADYPQVARYFPIDKEMKKLPRQYIANVIYTITGDAFAKWVEQQMTKRAEKIKSEQDMYINLDPEIMEIFRASQSISGKLLDIIKSFYLFAPCIANIVSFLTIVSKGNSSHLMKVSAKRRRTKEEVKEQKRAEANAHAELARRLAQIQELEKANEDLQQNLNNTEHVRLQVQSFIDEGQLAMDDSGVVSVVDDPARR